MPISRPDAAAKTAAEQKEAAEIAAQESRRAATEAEQAKIDAEEARRLAERETEQAKIDASKQAQLDKNKTEVAAAEGAKLVPRKPHPPMRLQATKGYTIICPFTGVKVPPDGTAKKVPVSNWLKSQLDAGVVVEVED